VLEVGAGVGVGIDADFVEATDEVGGDDIEGSFQRAKLVVGRDHLGEDLAIQGIERRGG